MKATLIAAALLFPTLVFAGDPAKKDGYGQQGAMTPTSTLNKLHQVSQKCSEKATVAQTNAGSSKVKAFAAQQQKDFQKLDQSVVAMAKDKNITLDAMADTMGSGGAPGTPGSRGPASDMDRMGANAPTSQMGTANETRTGSDTRMGPPSDSRAGNNGPMGTSDNGRMGHNGPMGTGSDNSRLGSTDDTRMGANTQPGSSSGSSEMKDKWDRLRSLTGPQFDAEFLTMTVEGARKNIGMLEEARSKGDRKLDMLIDQAIKTFRDHQNQAEKLQRDLRAS